MNEAPTVNGKRELEELPKRPHRPAEQMMWVERAAARLREQGRGLTGEFSVVPRSDTPDLVGRVESAGHTFAQLNWRLHGLS